MSASMTAGPNATRISPWVVCSLPWFLLNRSRENPMANQSTQQLVNELLGSAHLFLAAVSGVMEQKLLSEIVGKQLSLSQLKILKLLDLTEAHNVGDVAAFLGVSDAAASKAVDRLARLKYLRRTESRKDRRSSDLSLAAAGAKTAEPIRGRQGPQTGRDVRQPGRGRTAADFGISGAHDKGHRPRQRQPRRDLPAVRNLSQKAMPGAGGRPGASAPISSARASGK